MITATPEKNIEASIYHYGKSRMLALAIYLGIIGSCNDSYDPGPKNTPATMRTLDDVHLVGSPVALLKPSRKTHSSYMISSDFFGAYSIHLVGYIYIMIYLYIYIMIYLYI